MKNFNLGRFNHKQLKHLLQCKEVFVFDWDGTILNSMEIKSRNFSQAFCSTLLCRQEQELRDKVASHYLRLSGHHRKRIFLQIITDMGNETKPGSYEHFNDAFEELNRASLIHARIFPDALNLLEALIKRGNRIFISSSVPPQELADLVEATLPESFRTGIAEILGSSDDHTKGLGHIETVMHKTGATQDKLLVLGDDPADHELSGEAGVDCILVDRLGKPSLAGIRAVRSLIEVMDGLPK